MEREPGIDFLTSLPNWRTAIRPHFGSSLPISDRQLWAKIDGKRSFHPKSRIAFTHWLKNGTDPKRAFLSPPVASGEVCPQIGRKRVWRPLDLPMLKLYNSLKS